jgi:hypothetical protein
MVADTFNCPLLSDRLVFYKRQTVLYDQPQDDHKGRQGLLTYGPFSLCVIIQKEGLCPSSGDINRLMMMDDDAGLFVFYI